MIGENSNGASSDNSDQEPTYAFLNPHTCQQDIIYIHVAPSRGVTEEYTHEDIFLNRSSSDQQTFFRRYGGTQIEYAYHVSEVAIIMSRILLDCNGYLPDIIPLFQRYLLGYDQNQNPYGIAVVTQIETENGAVDLRNVIWTFTETPCEYFFAYLAFHRRVIAYYAPACENRGKFGRNRYRRHYSGDQSDTMLHTDTRNQPYMPTWQLYLKQKKEKNKIIYCSCGPEKIPCGSLVDGNVYNGCVNRVDYITIYSRMNDLLTQLVVGQNLLPNRHFLRAVFEIQYLFIHLMPYDRGSLAVMNIFRFVMLAYYNRRQPDPDLRLPLAPTRTDAYPDLYALLLCDTLEDFIDASFRDIYCVDYNLYCDD